MGEVYLARDTRLGREVALKVLPPRTSRDPDRLARFEREARAVAALNHPNIVTVHAIEEIDGRRVIAMERVTGRPLSAVIEPDGLPLARVLEIAAGSPTRSRPRTSVASSTATSSRRTSW